MCKFKNKLFISPQKLSTLVTLVFIFLHLTSRSILMGVSAGASVREHHYEVHDPGKLDKIITQGMPPQGDYPQSEKNDKLFLTQLISQGAIEKAQSLAFVDPEFCPVPSYSGFLTVNATYFTNLFFWFFPASYNPEEAPVMLWISGGPGASSLFGLFAENGPIFVDQKGYLNLRTYSWALQHSMLYIDNPAGVGFSFTEEEEGYAKGQGQVAENLYNALKQFFLLFPKFQSQDFYIAGQSYAGKFAPSLALKIHSENGKSPQVPINLKGLVLLSPYVEPLIQAIYGPFLHAIGLIDEKQRLHFDEVCEAIKKSMERKDWPTVHKLLDESLYGDLTPYPTLFYNMTGFRNYLNYLRPTYPPTFSNHRPFLRQGLVRTAIHVGNQKYHSFSRKVLRLLRNDMHKSGKGAVEKLLDLNYKFLFVSGQLDIVCHAHGVNNMVHELEWKGKEDFFNANRTTWKVNDEIAGFQKIAKNLAYVTIRNAGHAISHDKPLWAFTLVSDFTSGLLFDDANITFGDENWDTFE